jgi:hypothetical protein
MMKLMNGELMLRPMHLQRACVMGYRKATSLCRAEMQAMVQQLNALLDHELTERNLKLEQYKERICNLELALLDELDRQRAVVN